MRLISLSSCAPFSSSRVFFDFRLIAPAQLIERLLDGEFVDFSHAQSSSQLVVRPFLHDLETSGLQLPNYYLGQMRAFLRHDLARTSPIGIAFLRVAFKGRTNDVSRVGYWNLPHDHSKSCRQAAGLIYYRRVIDSFWKNTGIDASTK
jgi:hypothetical protein